MNPSILTAEKSLMNALIDSKARPLLGRCKHCSRCSGYRLVSPVPEASANQGIALEFCPPTSSSTPCATAHGVTVSLL